MNAIERLIDDLDPSLSAWLRVLKARLRNDQLTRVVRRVVAPGDVTVDVGANHGLYTVILSARVGRRGRVHAVEPYPGHAERLCTLARRRGNITFHPVALSDHPGEAELRVPLHAGRHIDTLATLNPAFDAPHQRFSVPLRTLDDLLRDEDGRVSFVKCDVEGHEHAVLEGASETLRKHRPIIAVEIEQRHRSDAIEHTFSYLAAQGYTGYFVTRSGLVPLAQFHANVHQRVGFSDRLGPSTTPDEYVNNFVFFAAEQER